MGNELDATFAGQSLTTAIADYGAHLTITSITGDGLLGSDVSTSGQPGSDGIRWIDSALNERSVVVSYRLKTGMGISHEALAFQNGAERVLNGVLRRQGLHSLELSHQDGYFMAGVRAVQVTKREAHFQEGTIEFLCSRPFLYRGEQTVSPSGGTVAIESNHFVEPVILWTTSSSVGAAWIEIDGKRLTIDTGISSGQQIRIDCARKETRIGGVLNVEDIRGVYPKVRDGSTVETSPGGSIEFQYQERWI